MALTRQQAEKIADQNEGQGGGYMPGFSREQWIQQAMIGNDPAPAPAAAAPAPAPTAAPQSPAMQALMPTDPGAGWATVGTSQLNPNLGKGQPPIRPALRALSSVSY